MISENKENKPKRRRKSDDIELEVEYGREMSPEEFNSLMRMITEMICEDIEKRGYRVHKPNFE